jgi:hypothetical protein
MKPRRDREEVKEVEPEENSEEEESGEEDQVDFTTVMRKSTWLEIMDLTDFEGYVDLVKGPLGFL